MDLWPEKAAGEKTEDGSSDLIIQGFKYKFETFFFFFLSSWDSGFKFQLYR